MTSWLIVYMYMYVDYTQLNWNHDFALLSWILVLNTFHLKRILVLYHMEYFAFVYINEAAHGICIGPFPYHEVEKPGTRPFWWFKMTASVFHIQRSMVIQMDDIDWTSLHVCYEQDVNPPDDEVRFMCKWKFCTVMWCFCSWVSCACLCLCHIGWWWSRLFGIIIY